MYIFETISVLGFKVKLDDSRLVHILLMHPEVASEILRLKETIENPDFVRRSKREPRFLLFYKLFPKTSVTQKYLMVGVKLNHEGEVKTSYLTDWIKTGEEIWRKK